ncbi:hypothetical protein BaRGS_00038536 [Batillaria attramentaria]|uniref:Uncharacterized protein n=1 Tax=Batillaria attramentaria TaxID=370345 RepID=A0ABD0J5L2_9CAEN
MGTRHWFCCPYLILTSFATSSPAWPCTGKQSSDNTALVAAFVAGAVTVVVIVIASCRECYRKFGPNTGHPSPSVELAMRERSSGGLETDGSRQSAHHYMEVPDSPPPSDEGSAADDVPPPPPVCRGPGNPPADYLNPQPSRDEAEEEGAEWKTVPFYQNTQLRSIDQDVSSQLPGSEPAASDNNQRADQLSDEVFASDNTPPTASTSTGKHSSDNTALVAAFVAGAVTVVVIVIASCRECYRKFGPNTGHPSPSVELAMRERSSGGLETDGSRQSAHHYMEVPDSPPPSDEGSAADDVPPPPPVCHGPGNPPADYLNPQPSRDEAEEEGAEWKTVPFYQNTQLRSIDQDVSSQLPGSEQAASDNNQRADQQTDEVFASANTPPTASTSDDTLESDYVPYAPPLYENTRP